MGGGNFFPRFASILRRAIQAEARIVEPNDSILVQRWKSGDRQAFTLLFRRYQNGVFAFCARMLRDSAAAEDAAQETFLKAHQAIASLADANAFRSWLFRIARNEVLMTLRNHRTSALESAESVWSDDDPHRQAVSEEQHTILQSVLDQLKAEYREAIVLREFQQLTYAEIAAATNSTESAVKSRIFKARTALASRIRTEYQ